MPRACACGSLEMAKGRKVCKAFHAANMRRWRQEKSKPAPPVVAMRRHPQWMSQRNCPCGSVYTEMHILTARKVVWLCRRCGSAKFFTFRSR